MKNLLPWFLGAALLQACASSAPAPQTVAQAAVASDDFSGAVELVWTDAFEREAVLIAREVSIEGPPGLLEHLALQQNSRDYDYRAEGTSGGFLQESTVKSELAATATGTWQPLRAELDNLMIAVSHRIRVLERPGVCDVIVAARGEVMWKCLAPAEEQRGETLRLVGSTSE